jgi:hypothetical protein
LHRIGNRALASVVSASALVGCGTATQSGPIGATLTGRGVEVTLQRVDRRPPIPANDITGLSNAASGDRLLGTRVNVCSTVGPAIGPTQFSVAIGDGGEVRPKYAATNYSNRFTDVRTGCASGWIVFEVAARSAVKELRFAFDNTSNGQPNSPPDASVRFSWPLDR